MSKLFPITMIVLSLLASLMYGLKGDIRHCLYWLFAAAINATVTF